MDINKSAPLMYSLLHTALLRNNQLSPWVLLARPSADSYIQPHPMRERRGREASAKFHFKPQPPFSNPLHVPGRTSMEWHGGGLAAGFRIRGLQSRCFSEGLIHQVELRGILLKFLKPVCFGLVPRVPLAPASRLLQPQEAPTRGVRKLKTTEDSTSVS